MNPKFKRKRLLVDPAFQFRLLGRMTVYFFLFAFFVLHLGFMLQVMADIATNGIRMSVTELYLEFLERQKTLLLSLALVLPILLYDLLKFSHRIAGPLFRCRKVMEEMAAGMPAHEFTPRKHDLMAELFQAFNLLIVEWNQRLDQIPKDQENPQEEAFVSTNNIH